MFLVNIEEKAKELTHNFNFNMTYEWKVLCGFLAAWKTTNRLHKHCRRRRHHHRRQNTLSAATL